ncbi:dynein axonemal heavy chain 8-like [Silurus meridionalis]|uniref:Dynein heavy chain tail domain-containing protein n=1 Tax=Silurus meridionalis TaxID=175797 RepID=A0A8T0AE59_SILME|nr:dynein axonemal heavy chain 8-like [Silurus meridionalis]XP_046691684.1 dynein axonemal heavy chain 8-like [Silurus meridionalis]XP_046691685.1 dynein axonemal heavy chain 8-like [Silurus meridionalis]XP_046691686.1 dynein axonemal heavy chain 8-like [Silurus meridionalis]KAF7690400.1 hypothetical protein HF521_012204 [Silurus meridionalis]
MENFKQARENRQSLLTASHQYLINVLASVLSLEESVAEEFILDSPSLDPIDDFFAKGGTKSIIFVYQESEVPGIECGRTFPGVEEGAKIMRLFLANLQETDLKGLCLFFMKNNVNVAINPDNIHQEISFFTLNASEGVLKGQQDLLSKVYLPAIGATEDWGILTNTEEEGKIKQDFTDVVSNYIKFIDETRTMLECSQLSEPSDIDFSTLVTLDDMKAAGADADMVRKCEEVLMVWCSEIDEVLTKSEIQKEDETAGIVTEIEQWKNMASKFSSINEQMKGTKIQTVLNFLLVIESKKMKIWQSMETRLMEHLKNAKDNIKLLSVLEKNCQPLYNFDPVTMAKSIQLITKSIFMIQYVSRYYSSSQHSTLLFIKVTNLLLTGCKAYITNNGSAQIWDQDPEIIIKKIEDCVGLFWEYQSCFHKIKEEILEQMPEGKIEVFEKPIFGKFERFCKRLQQISEMFTVVKTFSSLNQSKIERIDILAQKFQDICTNMKKNQDNALDHGKKEFEVEFAEFMLQINNLTVELEDFIRKRISESGPNAVNLLQRFQNLNMPCLEAEISKNYNLILKRQASELEHVKEHFHANKDDPPLVRNMPPVAGRILWVRNLLSKIEEPIRNIQENTDMLSTPEEKPLVQMYNRTAAAFLSFEILKHRVWMKEVSELLNYLQVDHPRFHMIIREARLIQKMGLEVPEKTLIYL